MTKAYTVIGRQNCRFCSMALEDLTAMGECAIYHDITADSALKTLLVMAGFRTVPQVFSPEGHHIGGYYGLVGYLVGEDEDPSVIE